MKSFLSDVEVETPSRSADGKPRSRSAARFRFVEQVPRLDLRIAATATFAAAIVTMLAAVCGVAPGRAFAANRPDGADTKVEQSQETPAEEPVSSESEASSEGQQPPEEGATQQPSPNQPSANEGDTAQGEPADAASDAPLLRFNFRFQPWIDVLNYFAEQADLSLVLDAPPPGTFNYSDARQYTPTEALDLLNGVLLTKGYTLIRRDRLLLLLNLADGLPADLIPPVTPEELDDRGKFEFVRATFPLGERPAEAVKTEIDPILGPSSARRTCCQTPNRWRSPKRPASCG